MGFSQSFNKALLFLGGKRGSFGGGGNSLDSHENSLDPMDHTYLLLGLARGGTGCFKCLGSIAFSVCRSIFFRKSHPQVRYSEFHSHSRLRMKGASPHVKTADEGSAHTWITKCKDSTLNKGVHGVPKALSLKKSPENTKHIKNWQV